MKRNASIELFRASLMFCICWLHAIDQGGYCRRGLDNVLVTALAGFVFLSGYFGIRFSWKKVGRLVLVGIYCSLFIAAAWSIVGEVGFSAFLRRIPTCVTYLKTVWFLWAYIMLMCLAPLVEPLVERMKETNSVKAVVPLWVMMFGWAYAAKVPGIKEFVPQGESVQSVALIFLGIYLWGRTCAVFEIDKTIRNVHLAFLILGAGAVCWIGFHHMNSLSAVAFATGMFILFKRIPISAVIGRIATILSPSLFSVYIIHTNGAGFEFIHRMEDWFFVEKGVGSSGLGYFVVTFVVAATVFSSCILLDIPRRLLISLFKRKKSLK